MRVTQTARRAVLVALVTSCSSPKSEPSPPPAPQKIVVDQPAAPVARATDSAARAGAPPPPRRAPTAWADWPAPNSPGLGLPNPQDYDLTSAGVVLDKVTGRMWQRSVDARNFTWSEAQRYCGQLTLAGHADWRVPSRIELVSILDPARSQPAISELAFPRTPKDWFWTSSVDAADPTHAAWYVYFYFGYPKTDAMTNPFRVRCVRDGDNHAAAAPPAAEPTYQVQKDVVRDRGTGLVWQRTAPGARFEFGPARAYCAKLRLGGKGGWRVPSMGELLTLVDERRSSPTIDVTAFPGASAESFWTSSLFAESPAMAWHVYFELGNALYGLLISPYRVRCVR